MSKYIPEITQYLGGCFLNARILNQVEVDPSFFEVDGFKFLVDPWKYRPLHSLKLTAKAPENRHRIPTIHFQVRTVSFREGKVFSNAEVSWSYSLVAVAETMMIYLNFFWGASMEDSRAWYYITVYIYTVYYIYIYIYIGYVYVKLRGTHWR